MFGRSDIGPFKAPWKLGRLNQFVHRSHYSGSHDSIALGVAINKYMRDNNCDWNQALENVQKVKLI
jgi:hypothetical protein